ncbi:hypothetical protein ACHAWU_005562 [Discostella pseudostelligera]|uniref:Uncharacterized protein n=1 Tax=Discostella pseudostelligera TaxID=259834 RepID=A0ABD3N8G1_9STRA
MAGIASASNSPPSSSSAVVATNAQPKKRSVLQQIFSLSTISSLAALFYVYFAFSNLLNLMYPLRNISQEDLKSFPKDRMVFPFWSWEGSGSTGSNNNNDELGMRVYLSTEPHFSLDFFSRNDEFQENNDVDGRDGSTTFIRNGNSFLLWSEDNALLATKTFPSRSFVLVASDDPSTICDTTTDSEQTCSEINTHAKESLNYANKWLEDSIKHEKQLQSDGGGLMAAMNSAGGGIESTSVLLSIYTSLHRNLKHFMDSTTKRLFRGIDDVSTAASNQSSTLENDMEDEPKSIIHISPQNPVWRSLMSNRTAYVHVLLIRQTASESESHRISSSPDPRTAATRLQQLHSQHNVLFGKVAMMKQELPLHVPSPKRFLYRDLMYILQKYLLCQVWDDGSCSNMVPPWNVAHHQPKAHREYRQARIHKQQGVKYPYWKPEVMIHLIQDYEGYPVDFANRVGFEIIQVGRGDRRHPSGYSYLPAVHVDEIGLTSDKYIPLNETVSALPLRIGFHSGMSEMSDSEHSTQQGLTPARYRLLNHLSSALNSQAEMGFEQSDIDDLRRLIAETNVMLLAITILASVLHLLFEFLTFKSDVDFWRGNTDLTGLSVRALFLDWISQVVILFYLIEMDSSFLMTIPTGVGMLIALWKCQRGAGLKFIKKSNINNTAGGTAWYNKAIGISGYELCATRLRAAVSKSDTPRNASSSDKSSLAALTEEMDQLATRVLGKFFLLPLILTYALYSLGNELHSGWYSWFITTASSFVYAIGFVLMTPQLFLNYKLKSVAHLPWRVLGYRFVNTFIDDLFAFIIRMPTMARMSCFRDDVVFIIYLLQRYLYPVDTSRPAEGAGIVEASQVRVEDDNDKKTK